MTLFPNTGQLNLSTAHPFVIHMDDEFVTEGVCGCCPRAFVCLGALCLVVGSRWMVVIP